MVELRLQVNLAFITHHMVPHHTKQLSNHQCAIIDKYNNNSYNNMMYKYMYIIHQYCTQYNVQHPQLHKICHKIKYRAILGNFQLCNTNVIISEKKIIWYLSCIPMVEDIIKYMNCVLSGHKLKVFKEDTKVFHFMSDFLLLIFIY